MTRRSFGYIRKLPSGRFQASYLGPDSRRYTARTDDDRPLTFDTKGLAGGFLARVQADIQRGTWVSPDDPSRKVETLAGYASAWLAGRDLAGSTRNLYSICLRRQILPEFGQALITDITPAAVRAWYAKLGTETGPRQRANAYGLLKTILGTAVTDDVIESNPCRVRGGGSSRRAKEITPATVAEVEAIADGMPPRLRALVLLASWCALRFGELAALTRADIDLDAGKVHVRRAVSREARTYVIKTPKTAAGLRTVAIPPHILPAVRDHLREHVAAHPAALLFPSERDPAKPLHPASLRRPYDRATAAAGRPGMTFHALRHTGAVLAAYSGATIKDLMTRLGHTTPEVAMLYQHVAADRDAILAVALSKLAEGEVIPMRGREKTA
jgi:integrase